MASSKIPVEIITYILRFLSVSDRKICSLVARRWYEASLDPSLAKGLQFVFGSSASVADTVTVLQSRAVAHVRLVNLDGSAGTKSTFMAAVTDTSMFDYVQSLSFKNSYITESVFSAVVSACPRLRSLDISACNSLFMSGQLLAAPNDALRATLEGIEELVLATNRYLSDLVFNRLTAACPRLRRLSLLGNKILVHSEVYYGVRCEATGETRANSAVLSFGNIAYFVAGRSEKILALDFSRTSMNGAALCMLAKIDGLRLSELRLAVCADVNDVGIITLSEHQPMLEYLDVSECPMVSDKAVAAIAANLTNLRDLCVAKCRLVTDDSVVELKSLKDLRYLDVNACYALTSSSLISGLCAGTMAHLHTLKLTSCSLVRDEFVLAACRCLPRLTVLDLSSCTITNKSVRAIAARLRGLHSLKLAWCQGVTDAGLLGLPDEGEEIRHEHGDHSLCRCMKQHRVSNIFNAPTRRQTNSGQTDKEIERALPSNSTDDVHDQPLSSLHNLRVLDLTSCYRLTDAGLQAALAFPSLRSLSLSLCPALTDATLAVIGRCMKGLEELSVAQCIKLTDKGMVGLVEQLQRLTLLDISSCDQLTNRTLEALFVHAQFLRQLDVSLCSHVSPEAVEMLEHNLRTLTSVQKRHIGSKAY